jgi:hypothetical protein
MAGPVIVLEFNELTPSLMDRFIGEGSLPAFAKLRRESIVCVSDAEEDPPFLEPWVQWVTVHTGLSRDEHKVVDLDDGPKLRVPRVWDIVSDAGKKAWVCGSMNAGIQADGFNGLFLPDPWTTSVEPHPRELFRPYYHFVRSYVQEYTRDKPPLTKADHLRFARFMATNGLAPKTVAATVRQLVSERGSGGARWQRAAILDRLQWDVFCHHYQKLNPALATFFLNSTAHYQHYYWRNLDPDRFLLRPPEDEQARYADAIRFGYRKMDEIVRDCLDLAGEDATIVFCTALGQQPMSKYDADSGKQHFKPTDPAALLRFAGVDAPHTYAPVMAENFFLHFEGEDVAEDARSKLSALRLDTGARVMDVHREGSRVHAGCVVVVPPPEGSVVSAPGTNRAADFHDLFYQATGLKSGMHHPDGILWIRTPERTHFEVERKVSIREIAPTLLALCGVEPPAGRFALPAMPELAGGKPAVLGSGSAPASSPRPPVPAET